MYTFKSHVRKRLYSLLKDKYPIQLEELEIDYAPQIEMGDIALAFPFQLAKKMKQNPRKIASEIASLARDIDGIEKIEVAGAGYINLFLKRKDFFMQRLLSERKSSLRPQEKKIIVEHTSINPNKAAHVGHLRNACLGDTLARCLIGKGENVEIQNYVDDTGVQVADVVLGFMDIEKKDLEGIKQIPERFDYYCWDLYTKTSAFIEKNPESQKRRSEILRKIEEKTPPESEIGLYISRRILKAHLKTMQRLGISYDLQACESSIIGLKFWDQAFSLLKEKQVTYFVTHGENKGCWVIKLEDGPGQEKIIVRSNGTVTYVAKDIAYQLWKFGLLKKDFHYKPFIKEKDKTVWITTSQKTSDFPHFGKASLVYNVIDTRQSYPQKVISQGLRSLRFTEQAKKSIHFSYEMVALSHQSLKELGQAVEIPDQNKNFLELSGRKGLGIKADDLLDRLHEKAFAEVDKRNPELPPEEKGDIAQKIACGALRYFMLKYARNSIIVFDFEDALSFEGETGPYLQYTLVRINSIFRKLKETEDFEESKLLSSIVSEKISLDALPEPEQRDFWDLVLYASKLDEEVLHSLHSLELLHLAKFTFTLCQKFNSYYHKYSILSEKNEDIRLIRILTVLYVRNLLETALGLMGIPQPEKM